MLEISIPGYKNLKLEHLVLDYNGTLATDGIPIVGCIELLKKLSTHLNIFVVTADTFGDVREQLNYHFITLHILAKEQQDIAKKQFIQKMGSEKTVAIGNGLNDALMLKEAALGIALIQQEGAAIITLQQADIVFHSIIDALTSLKFHKRLIASLRK